jgi:Holliday junction resolvase-like predicted endonuclease
MENDIEKKFIAMKTDSERNVAKFLLNKGFTFVDSNAQIGESLNELLGEIDLLVTIKDYLFLVEVSKEKILMRKNHFLYKMG